MSSNSVRSPPVQEPLQEPLQEPDQEPLQELVHTVAHRYWVLVWQPVKELLNQPG